MDLSRTFSQLRTATPLFAAIAVVALLYAPSLQTLWKKWVLWDQDLAHAIPTIGVMLVLLARRSYEQTTTREPPNTFYWLQILALTGCSFCWYVFESLSISLPAYFALIAILCLFISTSLSRSTLWATLPYIALLIFTIPIWAELTSILVKLSSLIVGQAVKLSQITVLLDGNSLFLPSGTIYIADGCSGLRYLIIALLMGYILILINQYKSGMALSTMLIALALGLLANWLRIYLLVLIGYHTEMTSSLMNDHESFGWVVFACILIPAIYFSPVSKPQSSTINIPQQPRFLPLLPLAIGPLLLFISSGNTANHNPLTLEYLAQYQAATTQTIGARLDAQINHKERKVIAMDGLTINVNLFTNTPQGSRDEIVPFIGNMVNRSEWVQEQSLANVSGFKIEIFKHIGGTQRIAVATQYVVGTMHTSNYWAAKFIQIIAKANHDNYFGLIVAQTNCNSDCTGEIVQLTNSLPTIGAQQH
ncbi:archaeosortase/exosortase family protein [Cellvibrio sp. NN19]|uniref:archaeosortase/exosortase family protein n=1 Tax=Cellvibrio chitinivorans TaxID=3102792 RepID=UPI002B40ADB3|nr:archaeosortase/exosortase family protein [Cellvibrio sp. NN19]